METSHDSNAAHRVAHTSPPGQAGLNFPTNQNWLSDPKEKKEKNLFQSCLLHIQQFLDISKGNQRDLFKFKTSMVRF